MTSQEPQIAANEPAPVASSAASAPGNDPNYDGVIRLAEEQREIGVTDSDPANVFRAIAAGQVPGNAQIIDPANPPAPEQNIPAPQPQQVQIPPVNTPASTQKPPETPANEPAVGSQEWFFQKTQGKFNSWEQVEAEMNKPAPAPQFANEQSKQVYDLLTAGKLDEVQNYFIQRHESTRTSTMTDEAIVKARIKSEYPSFDENDVNEEFAARYQPEAPDEAQLESAEFERAKRNHNRELKKATDRMKTDAEAARTYFSSKAEEIQLPVFQQQQAQAQLSPSAVEAVGYAKQIAGKPVEKVDVQYKSNDNTTQVNASFAFPDTELKPISDQISKAPEEFMISFIDNRWSKDGVLDVAAMARDIYLLTNQQKVGHAIAHETFTQSRLQQLQRDRNYVPNPTQVAGNALPTGEQMQMDQMKKFFRVPQ